MADKHVLSQGHNAILGMVIPSGNNTKMVNKTNRVAVSFKDRNSIQELLSSTAMQKYVNIGTAPLEFIFIPFQIGSAPSSVLPMIESGIAPSDSDIVYSDLLPFEFRPGHDEEFYNLITDEGDDHDYFTGLNSGQYPSGSIYQYRNYQDVRGVGLRLPLILAGWGYDLDGVPVPSGTSTDLFKGDYPSGYQVDPSNYVAAPLDVRYDRDRGVWAATGGMKKHQHLEDSNTDGGPAYATFFR